MTTLKESFKSYDRNVIPKDAKEVQRNETEKAFYAGAISVFSLMISDKDENDIDAINNELEAYFESIKHKLKDKQ